MEDGGIEDYQISSSGADCSDIRCWAPWLARPNYTPASTYERAAWGPAGGAAAVGDAWIQVRYLLSPVKTRGYRVELVRLAVRPSVPLDIGYFVHASLV